MLIIKYDIQFSCIIVLKNMFVWFKKLFVYLIIYKIKFAQKISQIFCKKSSKKINDSFLICILNKKVAMIDECTITDCKANILKINHLHNHGPDTIGPEVRRIEKESIHAAALVGKINKNFIISFLKCTLCM